MPKHVAIVFESMYHFSKGGAEKRLYEVARGLVAKGYRVSWFGFQYWEGEPIIIRDGISLCGIMPYHAMRSADGGRRSYKAVLKYCLELMKYRLPDDIDIILAGQAPLLHVIALKMKGWFKRPVPIVVDCWEVWHDHWIDYYGPVTGQLGKMVEMTVLRVADHLVAISDHTVKNILLSLKQPDKITLAHNGVDFKRICSIEPSKVTSDIIYFGRLVQHKNVDVLIRAVAIISRDIPDIRAFILGGGPEEERLRRLVHELHLEENVRFWGLIENHDEAMALLKSSKLSIIHSTSEGGGCIALFEANACGLPVIAVTHDQGIDQSLIDDGVNGFWIPELSDELIAQKAMALMNNPCLLKTMESRSHERMKNYDWSAIVENYDRLFRNICDSHG